MVVDPERARKIAYEECKIESLERFGFVELPYVLECYERKSRELEG